MWNEEFAVIYKVQDHLWAIHELETTILYVYEGEKRVLLLDTGYGLLKLPEMVRQFCPGKEIVVVNSHAHPDHNSGNFQFKTVYVGQMDEPASYVTMSAEERQGWIDKYSAVNPMFASYDLDFWRPAPPKKIVTLKEGDTIDLGGLVLEVIETPGHTVGSIALFDRANGLLFVGDTLLTWQVWGHLPTSSALKVYGDSLSKLAALQDQVKAVLPAHGVKDNPFGWPVYHMEPEVLSVYAQETQRILSGEVTGESYSTPFGEGLCALFPIGGMVYDPRRMGI